MSNSRFARKEKERCDYLIVDMSNLLYRTFFAHKNEDDLTVAGIASHSALMTLNKYFKAFQPRKKILMCFDRPNWRKEYTKSDECISGKVYKGNRRQQMTPREKQKYELFLSHLSEFEDMMRDHTTAVVLAADKLEADDLIAGAAEILSMKVDEATGAKPSIVVVSGDKDLIQVLAYPNVQLIDPMNGKGRSLDEWDGDAELFLFEKCIRGDRGDNVQSALPRCRRTKILEAYKDTMKRVNLMHETWIRPDDKKEMLVKDLFKENQKLMDLRCQPPEIQELMVTTILEGMRNPGKFSYFDFMKYLGKYELKKISAQIETFTPMLSL